MKTQKLWPHTTDCNLAKWRKSKNTNPEVGVSTSPSPLKWCFHTLQYPFFLLSFSQALASHLDQRIHIVFSLWNVSLQPPDLHDFYMWFFEELSYLQSWNDAMACARHTVSLQGSTWNLIMALNLQKKCSRAMAHVRNTQYKTNIGKSGQSLTRINFSCQKLSLLFSLCYRL